MNLGGKKLKKVLVLTALFISTSFFLLQSNSFSNATIRNEAKLSIVPEKSALIAIIYGEGKSFVIKNNTESTIEIKRIDLLGESEDGIGFVEFNDHFIMPGGNKEIILTGDYENLSGTDVHISVRWDSGIAEIKSVLPNFPKETQTLIDEELIIPVISGEQVKPTTDQDSTEPVIELEEPIIFLTEVESIEPVTIRETNIDNTKPE